MIRTLLRRPFSKLDTLYQKFQECEAAKVKAIKNSLQQIKDSGSYVDAKEVQRQHEEQIHQISLQQQYLARQIKLEKREARKAAFNPTNEHDYADIFPPEESKDEQSKPSGINQGLNAQNPKGKTQPDSPQQKQDSPQGQKAINVPPKLQIRVLKSPLNPQGQLILLGVQKSNKTHAQYVHDALASLKPQSVCLQMPPDQPFFIKTETDYLLTWKRFLETKDEFSFLINSQPDLLQDILLNEQKIQWLMRNNISKHPNFIVGPLYVSELLDAEGGSLEFIDVFKTPFLYSYNHKVPIIIGGLPELQYRLEVAQRADLKGLENLYSQKRGAAAKKQYNFDPLLLDRNLFIMPRLQYEIEVLKLMIYSSERSMAIVSASSVDHIEEEWQSTDHQRICKSLRSLQNNSYTVMQPDQMEFLKKLVLIDLLTEPYITNNFIRFQCFPYHLQSLMKFSLPQIWSQLKNDYETGRPIKL